MITPASCSMNVTEEDVETLKRICQCTVQTFEAIGDYFLSAFGGRHVSFSIGSAILLAFRESNGVENLRHRVILIYLLYRSAELDGVSTGCDILQHPFLSFFLAIMEYDKEENDGPVEVEMLGCPKLGPREKYITGCLLTGMLDKITNRTPVDITMMKIPKEDFDIMLHKTALKDRHARYPSVASVTTPAIIKISNGKPKKQSKLTCNESLSTMLLPSLLTNPCLFGILPPPFHRVAPSLMPPSDDEFQFLYPFILDPVWMEMSVSKQVSSVASPSSTPLIAVVSENKASDEKSESIELNISPPTVSVLEEKDVVDVSVDVIEKTSCSLPTTPSAVSPVTDSEKLSGPCRTSSMSALPTGNVDGSSVSVAEELKTNTTGARKATTRSRTTLSSASTEKKQPLTSAEATEMLKKSLGSIITRTDAQKLAEAIVRDPSLAKIIDIPLSKFDKYIDNNPAIAAAVIVARITKNCNELPQFFKLLAGMKISVQAMEVVNRLCTQVEFPQEYLNSYISTCVHRCEDPDQTPFSQCRQVRVVCVFLSSLIRNRTWDVRPLSVELQAFVLKFNHVREAASLYQAILMALQPSVDSAHAGSSIHCTSSRLIGNIAAAAIPPASTSLNTSTSTFSRPGN